MFLPRLTALGSGLTAVEKGVEESVLMWGWEGVWIAFGDQSLCFFVAKETSGRLLLLGSAQIKDCLLGASVMFIN